MKTKKIKEKNRANNGGSQPDIWEASVPLKTACLAWKILHDKVSTDDAMQDSVFNSVSYSKVVVLCEGGEKKAKMHQKMQEDMVIVFYLQMFHQNRRRDLHTMIVGEVANFVTYALGPIILVTALGALSIIIRHETSSFPKLCVLFFSLPFLG
ncbi:hypothetical protein C5167_026629 [Papaver somniferum]|nr:hypothetical protein C5167_026629 [Papaver somniferum]